MLVILLSRKHHLFNSKKQITRAMQTQIEQEEIQQDPVLTTPRTVDNLNQNNSYIPIWKNNLETLKENYKNTFQQGEKTVSSIPEDNSNVQDTVFPQKQLFYVPPIVNKEVLYTDMTIKTITANLETIDDKLNLQIKRSEELAKEWIEHIKKLDAHIEWLKEIRWKKMLTYSACVLAIIGFIWKMGMLRSIPNFTSNLVGFILDASKTGTTNTMKDNVAEISTGIPKPNLDSFKAIMESPITPAAFVMGVGGVAILAGTLKLVVWILRKAPK